MNRDRWLQCSCAKIWILASHVWIEGVRQRLLAGFYLLFLVLLVSSLGLRQWHFGSSELKFLADFGFAAISFFGSILTVVASVHFFFGELEHRTLLTLLAKPVSKSEFIVGKWLGVFLLMGAFCAIASVSLAGLTLARASELFARGDSALEAVASIETKQVLLVGLFQWLKFGVLAALVLLVATYARTALFALAVSFLLLAVCHLQFLIRDAYVGVEFVPLRWVARGCGVLLPNFQLFAVGEEVTGGNPITAAMTLHATFYGVGYTVAILFTAAFSFRGRDVG